MPPIPVTINPPSANTHACAICGHDCQTPDRNWIDGFGDRFWLCDRHWSHGNLWVTALGHGRLLIASPDTTTILRPA